MCACARVCVYTQVYMCTRMYTRTWENVQQAPTFHSQSSQEDLESRASEELQLTWVCSERWLLPGPLPVDQEDGDG